MMRGLIVTLAPNLISKQKSIFVCLIIVKVSSIAFDNEVQLQNILFEYENEELRKKTTKKHTYIKKEMKNASKINDFVSFYEVVDVHIDFHNNQYPYYFQTRRVVMVNHMNMNCKYSFYEKFLNENNDK